jgi:hypothetical protein
LWLVFKISQSRFSGKYTQGGPTKDITKPILRIVLKIQEEDKNATEEKYSKHEIS